jgi:hypothetical protein
MKVSETSTSVAIGATKHEHALLMLVASYSQADRKVGRVAVVAALGITLGEVTVLV